MMFETAAKELGLTMTTTFVPWSVSRNKDEKNPSLNWKVTIHKDGRPALTVDYSAGMAHCPYFNRIKFPHRTTVDDLETIKAECETGKPHYFFHSAGRPFLSPGKGPIEPRLDDVLASLVLDAEVLDHPCFESWAEEHGYSTDSRKAEATYRACLDIALRLRAAIGEDGMVKLRQANDNYQSQ